MTLDEARAYLRSRPMDLKAKEVLELLDNHVLIKREFAEFLRGTGELEGKWYGENDERGRRFWWRRYIPTLPFALTHSRQE
jgi:hypothetical protein